MAGRGMGAATQGGGCVTKGPKNRMIKATSKTTGPIMMKDGGDVDAYEILGRRVSKEQYDDAAKRMDSIRPGAESDMDDFVKMAKERAKGMGRVTEHERRTVDSILNKKKGGMINAHKKMAMGKKKK